jgi:hypothetical protein
LKAAGIPVVALFLSGRPMFTNPEINAADAFVAGWLPGSQAAGVADVLVVIGGPPVRFGAGLALTLRYRLESPPAEDATLWLGSRGLKIGAALKPGPDWATLTAPLACFGGDPDAAVSAIRLTTSRGMTWSFEDLRLTSVSPEDSCAGFSQAEAG